MVFYSELESKDLKKIYYVVSFLRFPYGVQKVFSPGFIFVHLDQNSGPLKTQVSTETQGIFPKTQGISTKIWVILVIIGQN